MDQAPKPLDNKGAAEFARQLVALARKHGVRSIAVQYRSGQDAPGASQSKIAWQDGPLGAPRDITIEHCEVKLIGEAA